MSEVGMRIAELDNLNGGNIGVWGLGRLHRWGDGQIVEIAASGTLLVCLSAC